MNAIFRDRIFHGVLLLLVIGFFPACKSGINDKIRPVSIQLYDTIIHYDSNFYEALKTCKLDKLDSLLYQDLEYIEDESGLSASKEFLQESLKKMCGSKRKPLIETFEVYPIRNFGAIHLGVHSIYQKDGRIVTEKFVNVWRNDKGRWKLTKMIKIHPNGEFKYNSD